MRVVKANRTAKAKANGGRDPIDRLVNPSWAFVRVGRGLRLNLPALALLGFITYTFARRGPLELLLWLAVAFLLWGWPLVELKRAQRGHYSWMYPKLTLAQLERALTEPSRLTLSSAEREVLNYLLHEPLAKHFADNWAIGQLMRFDQPPFTTNTGSQERLAAVDSLLARGYLKPVKGLEDAVELDLRQLAPLVAQTA